jgi:hypothetical protein
MLAHAVLALVRAPRSSQPESGVFSMRIEFETLQALPIADVICAFIRHTDAALMPPVSLAVSRTPFPALRSAFAFSTLTEDTEGLPSRIDRLRAAANPRRICSRLV